MKKVFISLIVMLMIIGLSAPIMDVFALDDLADAEAGPYNDPNQEITSINEDGTIVDETIVETSISTQNDSSSKESANRYARDANGITSNSTAVVNFRTKSNASINTEYKEDGTNRAGYVNGYYAADAAFLGFDNDTNPTKVKFLQAGVIGWVNYSEVDVYNYTDSRVNTTSKYYVSNGRLYHGIVTNLASNGYSSSLDCGPKPSYLQEGKTYFSYDGHYFYTYDTNNLTNAYAKMLNDYRNNVRTNAINANDPYYNYYLYLSHRSVTEYSASELNEAIANFSKSTSKMRNLGQCFIDNQNLYGANALLMIGVAANESAWGSSNIAMTKNNLFGHAAYDSDPNGSANGYSSVEYSVYYHAARFVSKGYLDCITDSRYYGSFLGDKASGMAVKYASDPYWGEKAAAMAWKVDSYLGGKDAKKYTIAIKDTIPSGHSVIDIKSLPSSSSTTLYKTYPVSSKTTYKSYAPSNYAFIVLEDGQTNGYYKIQCDSEVNSSRTAIINQEAYTFANSYGYIPTNSVRIVSKGSNSTSEVDKNTSNVEGESTGKGAGEPTLYYQSNVKYYGWLDEVNEPNTTGTTGQSLDLYQLKLRLENVPDGAVISARIFENEKWINYDSIDSNTVIGNANVPIQKISFTLTGLSRYKLQYRVHSTDIDWQAWVDAGTETGTAGKNIQAIDFRLVADDTKPIIYYQSNVQNCGWLDEVRDSNTTGTTGQSLGLYQLKIKLINVDSKTYLSGKVYTNEQWLDYDHINQDTILGNSNTTMEKVSFDLNGLANYKLQYRVHSADVGWQDWTNSGNETGTAGKRIEAIEFRLIDEEPVYIKDITLNKSSITLNKGKNETLEATISPDDTTEDKTV
ncbi:glucosaminidase domain-containing protein, partial [[Clostridium] spiroforme]|nr:glucosaminidase domain-containing protein [Thomasclavelia spiroformis]